MLSKRLAEFGPGILFDLPAGLIRKRGRSPREGLQRFDLRRPGIFQLIGG